MRILTLIITLFCLTQTALSQTADDAIVISDATSQYWPISADDSTIKFKNKTQTTYLAERMGGWLQSAAYYGNSITLDSHSAGLGNIANHKVIEPPGVFYDDTRVCFYQIYLSRKGKKASTRFERTFNDPRYMECIFLDDDYLTRHKQVEITLPKGYRLTEYNLNSHITKSKYTSKQGDTVVCYTITDMPAAKSEPMMPSALKIRPYVILTGAFSDVHHLYRWSMEQSDVDCHVDGIDSLAAAIMGKGIADSERISRTLAWVQANIRYVAYEAGKASHQPDTPAEVLRKRYGDCKGMALLLRTLLRTQGIDARLAFIGTDRLPWYPSELPDLCALNHVVCGVCLENDTLFLDATNRYLPATPTPCHLQGREALLEDGYDGIVMHLPTLPPSASTDSLSYDVTLANHQLDIHATAAWSGVMKEMVLRNYHSTDTKDKGELMQRLLNADDRRRQVEQATWTTDTCSAKWAILEGQLHDQKSVIHTTAETYIELDPHNDILATPIDTTQRVNDVELPLRCQTIREVRLHLPEGQQVSWLPKGIIIRLPQGEMSCSFVLRDGDIIFRKVMIISQRIIPLQDINTWNNALRRWHDASHEQVILKTTSS